MLTNERIRRLVETDRDALVELLAAAMANQPRVLIGPDPDALALFDDARRRAGSRVLSWDDITRWRSLAGDEVAPDC